MLKDEILNYLSVLTKEWSFDAPNDAFSAEYIAEKLSVRRNTISHYLNAEYSAGKCIKINTRPVYFLDLEVFSQQFGQPSKLLFSSVGELQDNIKAHIPNTSGAVEDCFHQIVGANGSLKSTVKQMKAALLYPGLGLPILITGPSGVGKSMLAELAYRFCVDNHIIKSDAPFLTLNCAQYASNPELLSSNLFGHVKGAFTGAVNTVRGMLESADTGILFLDEVHRLDHVGQEKLFTFMDQGVFRRIGESDGWHRTEVRLIFATTEDPESCMLTTFLRRIPIRINMPSLSERREQERMTLIYNFFLAEAKQLPKPLLIPRALLTMLNEHLFPGNLGDLWNVIKCLCAAGFARSAAHQKIIISPLDLPEQFSEELPPDTDSAEYVELSGGTELSALVARDYPQEQAAAQLHQRLLELYRQHSTQTSRFLCAVNDLLLEAKDRLHCGPIQPQEEKRLKQIDAMLRQILVQSASSQIIYSSDASHLLTCYLYLREQGQLQASEDQKDFLMFWNWCQQSLSLSSGHIFRILQFIERKFDLPLDERDYIFIALLLHVANLHSQAKRPRALILAHGDSTASSIANVVNRTYHETLFDAFDVPLDCAPESTRAQVTSYLSHTHLEQGLIMLVDTGSLLWLYRSLGKLLTCPVLLISNVTTQTALQVGALIQAGVTLDEILEEMRSGSNTEYKLIQPSTKRRNALLVHAIVGAGTAQKVKSLLKHSLPPDVPLQIILSNSQEDNFNVDPTLLKDFNVLAIVGATAPKNSNATYISLEDLMSGRGEERLHKALSEVMDSAQIKYFCAHLIQNFSLDRLMESLTILDHQKILAHVDQCLMDYQSLAQVTLSNPKKHSIYVHVSCLVERLIRQAPIETYPNYVSLTTEHEKTISYIRQAFHRLEEVYSISIPFTEIGYLCDILLAPNSQETYSNSFDTD